MTRPLSPAGFWAKVDQSGGLEACWPWTAALISGYGRVPVLHRNIRAHRMAYQLAVGPIPDGLIVRHTCDNPPCCNPRHLLVGTVRDNARDAAERGRLFSQSQRGKEVRQGERNPNALLTAERVRAIRRLSSGGLSALAIAQEFGVTRDCIYDVLHRRRWTHVA